MGTTYPDKVIISVGGSLIVPNDGIDTDFLINLNGFVKNQLTYHKGRQFFLVVGGGSTARKYRDAGETVLGHALSADDLDWLGIHATRLNAQLVRTIFKDIAHPFILKHYEIIRKVTEQVVVAAGWKPGWSTDYCAVLLAEDYGVKKIVNLSNIDQVFDKDPGEFSDAKPIDKISWVDFRKIVGDTWDPGMNVPFDPIAAKKAQELGLKVAVLNGKNLDNIFKFFHDQEFVGTVIE
ncbi:MAG: aspartate kinase [Candidatus Levybacteria bacterium RIFCSPHIGHO2_12_FULL_38_12]|nr:MAG: aspartate kinase [Candidatus Levybacteria bacterium RIFCSPHIGHO2_01_FULL_38_12]OGH23215.1 MAG: aspartate kinase [Candidatus Levybacteria bacterium RIFCSPHIGHO2_12_FULL_38_12]OGH34493.1 MAG: aspartate kinase [Candidatus Levybacteria bacterium RIFCSPLOWO2_01_FULL_37_20]OGH44741.1 MAG: aspartate kinase [Candidatus Levybacteria bacterium RIFCSPLOWO2_02_FULL_37_18]